MGGNSTHLIAKAKANVKLTRKSKFLSKPEERIILYLIQNEPKTRYETDKAIPKAHYPSSHAAFKSLEAKGYIKKVSVKTHWGREYPRYWLTELGILEARFDGADQKLVWKKAQENYPENKLFLCILRTAQIIGIEPYNIAYSALLTKGKLEPTDEGAIFVSQLVREQSPEKFIQLCTILEEEFYEVYRQVEENLAHVGINLREILKKLKEVNQP